MNFILRLQNWYRTDPNALKKIGIVAGGVLFSLILLLFIISSFSSGSEPQDTNTEFIGFENEFTEGNFQRIDRVEAVTDNAVRGFNAIGFSGSDLFYTDSEFIPHLNSNSIGQERIINADITISQDEVFYSTSNQDWYYLNDSFIELPASVQRPIKTTLPNTLGLSPIDTFVFAQDNETNITIVQSINLFSSQNNKDIQTITPGINFKRFELINLNDEPYIVVSDGSLIETEGNVEIWKIYTDKVELVQRMNGVFGVSYGPKHVMYTSNLPTATDLTPYQQNLIQFDDRTPNGSPEVLNIPLQLAQDDVYGSVLAPRCSFHPQEDLMYCLVKKQAVGQSRLDVKDEIALYDIQNRSVSLPYTSISISASKLVVSSSSEIHFVGQADGRIYKITS